MRLVVLMFLFVAVLVVSGCKEERPAADAKEEPAAQAETATAGAAAQKEEPDALDKRKDTAELPDEQKEFQRVMHETATAYREALSQEEREEAVGKRRAFLEQAAQNPVFEGWICKLDQVREKPFTQLPRKLYLVKVRCGGMVLQNVMLGHRHGATPPEGAIEENTPLHVGFRSLNIRNTVRVSGRFIADEESGLLEESYNEALSMELPHFGVVYSTIHSPYK